NVPTENICGPAGAWLAFQLHDFLGDGAYPLLLFATLAAAITLLRGEVRNGIERVLGLTLLVPCTSASAHLIASSNLVSATGGNTLPVGHGGVVGYALGNYLNAHLSPFGTFIVLASCLFVGLLFVTEGWVLKLPSAIRRASRASSEALVVARDAVRAIPIPRLVPAGATAESDEAAVIQVGTRKKKSAQSATVAEPTDDEQEPAEGEAVEDAAVKDDEEYEYEYEDEEEEPAPQPAAAEKKKPAPKFSPKVNFPRAPNPSPASSYPREIENWTLPSLSLLEEPEYGFSEQQEVVVREQAMTLERTLEEFRLDAHVVEIDTGPVITMFELKIGKGIKVSQIASLSNDIARALKAHAVRVVAPIPGKNTVGIEVPNIEKETVRMKELMTLAGKRASGMKLPLFLGKDAGGAALVADLTKMPHLLMAGTTGSGKSVCINSIIVSLLMTQRPDHTKLILVDPKMVEMSQYKNVPHLMCPIITDPAKAEKVLEWGVTKMEERYELLAEVGVKNIAEYNSLGAEEVYKRLKPASEREKKTIATHLPYIVVIIDELADLMMTSGKEVEHHLARLAQKSRAVGLHIIVATQRPEAKIVTGLIKSNLPCRICFRVASRMDSRIVLDQNGGEVLMGQGDMLFLPPGSHKLIRSQGTFLGDDAVRAVIADLTSRAEPEFHPELVKIRSGAPEGDPSMRDPLFDQAVRLVIDSGRGSVSLLQRRLTVGYSRASRLIEQMSDAGIVGGYKGSQAREVAITLEQWDALQAQVARDIEAKYEADADEDPLRPDDPDDPDDDGDEDATDAK
ncbi:MAG: DNA translocase FtsK 4TM domain-containing protein, partial [Planctomycetes bacterium]|nr:DNA translocase FtsK 4TM domain-containing protein [Planctomycetota bacterium]